MKTIEETIKDYERYILKVATSLNQDEYKDDLIQEGRIAIVDAYANYNESMGEFHPYCLVYIKGRMKTFLSKNARTVRIPMTHFNNGPYSNKKYLEYQKVSFIVTDEEGNQVERDFIDEVEDNELDDQEYIKSLRLTNALSNLKELHQDLLTMRYVEGLTYKEIADELGITKQGVMQLVATAIKKIKKELIK